MARLRHHASSPRPSRLLRGALHVLALCLLLAPLVVGCASGPGGSNSNTGGVATGATGSPTEGGASKFLQFRLTMNDNGSVDATQGVYAIVMNSFGDPIDVSSSDKFTDYMVYDGNNLIWYTRQTSGTNSNFLFVAAGLMTPNFSLSTDRRTMIVTINTEDTSSPLNIYVKSQRFTCAPVTTDRSGYLGRVIDTLGPGPDLAHDTLYTITVDKTLGAIGPLPSAYPTDALNDWIVQPDVDLSFPYTNYDIKSFEVLAK